MKKEKNDNKKIFLMILGLLLLFCSVLVFGYAIFIFKDVSNHDNTIRTGTISFSYNEDSNGIELVNAIPIRDEVGKKLVNNNESEGINQGYFDFSVKSMSSVKGQIKYQVYATIEDDSDMDPEYIKVYLTNELDRAYEEYSDEVPVYAQLKDYTGAKESKLIYEGKINNNKNFVQKFRLRLWVDQDYTDGSTSKTFKIKINVKATA